MQSSDRQDNKRSDLIEALKIKSNALTLRYQGVDSCLIVIPNSTPSNDFMQCNTGTSPFSGC